MKWILIAGLLVVLAGCHGSSGYAGKLGLEPINAPAVLAPIQGIDMAWESMYGVIQDSQQPSDLDVPLRLVPVYRARMPKLLDLIKSADPAQLQQKKDDVTANYNSLFACVEQAGQIKRAELQDGDKEDKSGEVAQRLAYAKQYDANAILLCSGDGAPSLPNVPTRSNSRPGGSIRKDSLDEPAINLLNLKQPC